MKKYIPYAEDNDYYWCVELRDVRTGKPFTWVSVDKSEFPTKEEAIDYLATRYKKEERKKYKKPKQTFL